MGDLNELVERLDKAVERCKAVVANDVHSGLNVVDFALIAQYRLSEAAAALTSLIAERDAATALNNKYAWERDKAREERDAAERRSEAHWKPRLEAAEAQLKAAREALERIVSADTKLIYRGMATVADRTEIGPAGEIAMAALSLDTNKEVR